MKSNPREIYNKNNETTIKIIVLKSEMLEKNNGQYSTKIWGLNRLVLGTELQNENQSSGWCIEKTRHKYFKL